MLRLQRCSFFQHAVSIVQLRAALQLNGTTTVVSFQLLPTQPRPFEGMRRAAAVPQSYQAGSLSACERTWPARLSFGLLQTSTAAVMRFAVTGIFSWACVLYSTTQPCLALVSDEDEGGNSRLLQLVLPCFTLWLLQSQRCSYCYFHMLMRSVLSSRPKLALDRHMRISALHARLDHAGSLHVNLGPPRIISVEC